MKNPFPQPLELSPGARRDLQGNVVWNLWAPNCSHVDLVTWTDGTRSQMAMTDAGDGYFTHTDAAATAGLRYAFQLPSGDLRPDPASRWQPDGVHEPSALFFPATFAWTDDAWRGVPWESMVIYELHIGTFTPAGTFDAVIPRLAELVELGVTAIEIMPVSQFPGERNWGYDGVHPFAVQNSYGGPLGLQRLVNAAHAAGLAVLLDVVYNHLGPEGNYLSEFGPYYNPQHHTPWGPAINFDGPECGPVRRFFIDNAIYWIRDFQLDGLRLDAVQTMVDDGARHILEELQTSVQEVVAGTERHVHVIGETNQNDARLVRPKADGGYALDGFWADDLHHSLHGLLTGESDGYYADFGSAEHVAKVWERGVAYDGCYSRFRRRRHGNSMAAIPKSHFVVGLQNHDQVGNRFDSARFSQLASPAQQRLAAAMVLLSPFTPLLYMGEEYGETAPFPFFCSFLDRKLNRAVGRGRKHDFEAAGFLPRPGSRPAHARKTWEAAVLSWNWQEDPGRAGLRRLYQTLLAARQAWPPLQGHDPATCRLSDSGVLTVTYAMNSDYRVMANFSDQPHTLSLRNMPAGAAVLLATERPDFGGQRSDDGASPRTLAPYEVIAWGPAAWSLPQFA